MMAQFGPEESQGDHPTWPPIYERRWRNQAILLTASETELKEVYGHKYERDQTNDAGGSRI